MSGRDKGATWCSTGETGASKPELVHELLHGLPYRTYPPDIPIDWSDPYVVERFDVQDGLLRNFVPGPRVPPILAFRQIDVAIKVLWPPVARDAAAPSLPSPSADAPTVTPPPAKPQASKVWAPAAARRLLRDEGKISDDMEQWEVAELLAAESKKAVEARLLRRALKASYIENQLRAWNVWPLSSLK